jgi:hypothetical protein
LDPHHEDIPASMEKWGPYTAAIPNLPDGRVVVFGNEPSTSIFWEKPTAEVLRTAKRRLRTLPRRAERVDRWLGEQTEVFPHLSPHVERWVYAAGGFALGLLVRHLLGD